MAAKMATKNASISYIIVTALMNIYTGVLCCQCLCFCYLYKRDITGTDNGQFDCRQYVFQ